MSKLKILKTRMNDEGHEFDLRGLGEDVVFKQIDPIVALTAQGSSVVLNEIEKIAAEFDGGFQFSFNKNELYISYNRLKNPNHKEHSILLFALFHDVIRRLNSRLDASFTLWQADPMRFHLSKQKNDQFRIQNQFNASWDHFFHIKYPVNLYLAQSGFRVEKSQDGFSVDRLNAIQMVHDNLKESYDSVTTNTFNQKIRKGGSF